MSRQLVTRVTGLDFGAKVANPETPRGDVHTQRSLMQSPKIRPILTVLAWLAFAILNPQLWTAHAQQYAIDWFTINGGGGTSTGGLYTVTGTVGQPDAGVMSGGPYSLTGGFWALSAVQTPGAPWLAVWRTPTNSVVVFWPSSSIGFALYQNTNLGTTNWVPPAETVHDDGTNRFIIVNPPTGNRFYRLHKP